MKYNSSHYSNRGLLVGWVAFCSLRDLANIRPTTNLAPCHSSWVILYVALLTRKIETSEKEGRGFLRNISTLTTFQWDYNKSWWRDIWLQRTSLCGDLIRRECSNPPFFICSSLSTPKGWKAASDFWPPPPPSSYLMQWTCNSLNLEQIPISFLGIIWLSLRKVW